MKYVPTEARCVFIDGPVAVFIHEAPEQVILDAYDNLKAVVKVAAAQLDTGHKVVGGKVINNPGYGVQLP